MNKILGYSRMMLKGDQEPALRTLMDRMEMLCGEQCDLDGAPVGDSQSNGSVESRINKRKDNSAQWEELWKHVTERKSIQNEIR